ncbi:MAG: cation:proton antiporter, partial [Actinobacteria bacterium]|nr:cation:proton antiporter [Actinomycetota bacterium]
MLATVGLLGVAVAATSGLLERTPLNPALLALALGVVIGPELLGLVDISSGMDQRVLSTAARLLLAVGLMGVALRYPVGELRQRVPGLLLLVLVVLPLMAGTVALGAMWILGVPFGVAAVIGAVLSPTDPVLASSVVTGEPAERDIPVRLRQLLSVESAANDGLALPLVLVAVALAGGTHAAHPLAGLGKAALEVVIGTAIGAAVGTVAGHAVRRSRRGRRIEPSAKLVFPLVLAFAVLGVAGIAQGDAILGVFVAGLVYNHLVSGPDREAEVEIDEGVNQFLVLPVFALLGVVLPWEAWAALGWGGPALVAVALLLRRLPWILALRRPLGLGGRDALWLGWFGPIGVAALFYLGLAHEQGVSDPAVWHAGTLVIAASTLFHGASAAPGRHAFA